MLESQGSGKERKENQITKIKDNGTTRIYI